MARGDHLVVQRFGFTHHGIDLGDGTVIEYGGKMSGRVSVRRVHISVFASGGAVGVQEYLPGWAMASEQTVAAAWSRLGESLYSAFKNNCEHFAYWCKTGQHYSPQANGLRQIVTVGTAVGLIALVAAALNDKD